jgi:hypothetical protein
VERLHLQQLFVLVFSFSFPLTETDYHLTSGYADLVNNVRSLPLSLSNANTTVEACLSSCKTAGAVTCGLSYGGECYGSKTAITTKVLPDASCHFPCKGNPLEMCGGNAALSVWNVKTTKKARRGPAIRLDKAGTMRQ